ncbi:hypothetical protein T459_08640 [Capsicum annuum]|uniref:Uncharacterized protein n=1 Tax=Capsicum annuum TaxID=4072 RepID=A0A2G2ZX43_CAPAN|nr:hypothetical protein T459_08640 [Capsicum annuum]
MDDKRARGLCFWCDENFVAGHNCRKRKKLFIFEVDKEIDGNELEECLEEPMCLKEDELEDPSVNPQISVHAMDGTVDYRTMRVKVALRGKMVYVLINSGATHNFIDVGTAKRLGCQLEPVFSFAVSVENGSKVYGSYVSKDVKWKM